MENIKIGDVLSVEIVDYGANCEGIARHNGCIIFVPFALKTEVLSVEIIAVKQRFATAKIIKIITPSKARVAPPCPYFTVCGGCDLQHTEYRTSLEIKRNALKTTLKRIGGISNIVIDDVVPSAQEYGYRNKITLHNQNGKLCMFKKDSNDGVEIEECILSFIDTKKIIRQYNEVLKSNPQIKQVIIKQDSPLGIPQVTTLNAAASANEKIDISFEQVNPYVADAVYKRILNTVKDAKTVINAYSGEGALSFDIAKQNPSSKVFGIELSKLSHQKAEELRSEFKLKNLKNICGYAEIELLKLTENLNQNFTLILDPPRGGLTQKVISAILKTKPASVLYLSCNPATLSRDLKELLSVYQIKSVSPYDMFPQTKHLETLVILELINKK